MASQMLSLNSDVTAMSIVETGQQVFGLPPRSLAATGIHKLRWWPKETYIAVFAAVGIAAHLVDRFALHAPVERYNLPLILVLSAGGLPLLFDLARRLARREFGSDLLAGISIGASAVLSEYLAGSIVVLMLAGGTALEQYATRRASAVLAALARRMPERAHRLTPDGCDDISLREVRLSDRLMIFPHEICPV